MSTTLIHLGFAERVRGGHHLFAKEGVWTYPALVDSLLLGRGPRELSEIARFGTGRRRNALEAAMRPWLERGFSDRILAFDSAAAQACAEIAAERRQAGRPIGEADCQIAAISRSRGASLVTRNIRDFEGTGVEVIDPWATG